MPPYKEDKNSKYAAEAAYEKKLIEEADFFIVKAFRGYGKFEEMARTDTLEEIMAKLAEIKKGEPGIRTMVYAVTTDPTGRYYRNTFICG